ncbi:TrmH family RNA methyltransferase [Wenyingzhuangia sp. IMCC45574]
MEQLDHTDIVNSKKTFPLVVLGDEIRTPQNIGMCIRACEAFGVERFYQSVNSPDTNNRTVQRTARNTEKKLPVTSYTDIVEASKQLKNEGYTIIALEITDKSKSLHQYNFTQHGKIALIIGSERFGITPEVLELVDSSIHIPMFGNNSSMNVVNSLSVSLYEITKQLNKLDTKD